MFWLAAGATRLAHFRLNPSPPATKKTTEKGEWGESRAVCADVSRYHYLSSKHTKMIEPLHVAAILAPILTKTFLLFVGRRATRMRNQPTNKTEADCPSCVCASDGRTSSLRLRLMEGERGILGVSQPVSVVSHKLMTLSAERRAEREERRGWTIEGDRIRFPPLAPVQSAYRASLRRASQLRNVPIDHCEVHAAIGSRRENQSD